MSKSKLTVDSEAQTVWEKLPKNKPSRQAMPPMTGGTGYLWGLLVIVVIIVIFGLLQGRIG